MIGYVQRVETQPNMMAFSFSMIGAKIRDSELTIDFDVQCKKRSKPLPVWNPYVILQRIDVGIRLSGVPIRDGAELQLLGQGKYSPGHYAIGDVVGENSVNIGADHRLLERNEYAGKIVQVSAGLASDVRRIHFVASPNAEMDGGFQLAIMR